MSDPKNESEILFTLVKQKYGDRLSEEQLIEVKSNVEKIVETAIELREVKLDNSDEPFSVFIPYTRAGK
jgi:hypothetical protein